MATTRVICMQVKARALHLVLQGVLRSKGVAVVKRNPPPPLPRLVVVGRSKKEATIILIAVTNMAERGTGLW
jgi:hypothetical protein